MATAATSFVVILGLREASTTSLVGTVEREPTDFTAAKRRRQQRGPKGGALDRSTGLLMIKSNA
jgi:hypothetical protein